MVKSVLSLFERWIFAAMYLPEKHKGSFFSLLQQQLSSVFEFSNSNMLLSTSWWELSDSTISLNQSNHQYGIQYS